MPSVAESWPDIDWFLLAENTVPTVKYIAHLGFNFELYLILKNIFLSFPFKIEKNSDKVQKVLSNQLESRILKYWMLFAQNW